VAGAVDFLTVKFVNEFNAATVITFRKRPIYGKLKGRFVRLRGGNSTRPNGGSAGLSLE
jgi:hypothetical protein